MIHCAKVRAALIDMISTTAGNNKTNIGMPGMSTQMVSLKTPIFSESLARDPWANSPPITYAYDFAAQTLTRVTTTITAVREGFEVSVLSTTRRAKLRMAP